MVKVPKLRPRLRSLWDTLAPDHRRIWVQGRRAHIEVGREILANSELGLALEKATQQLPGVVSAHLNAPLQRLVVEFDPEAQSPEALGREVHSLEACRGDTGAFRRGDPGHPGDDEALTRTVLELAADGVGIALGLALRLARSKRPTAEIDIAAVLALVEALPQVRRLLDRRLGPQRADLLLSLGNAVNNALMQTWLGTTGDALRRYLRLRELMGRRALFEALEPTLEAGALAHQARPAARRPPGAQPPLGPIERFSAQALVASLGGFGLSWTSTGSMGHAAAAVFGGIPRPAWLGREAFASALGERAAARQLLVMNPDALRQLDRITTLFVDGASLTNAHPGEAPPRELMQRVYGDATRAGLELWVEHHDRAWLGSAEGVRIVAPANSVAVIAERQRTGGSVCFVGGGSHSALSRSDVSLGIRHPDHTVPWHADVIGGGTPQDLLWLIDAITAAKAASLQSVAVAVGEVIGSAIVSRGGLRRRTTRKVMSISSGAALLAMANGVRLAHGVTAPASATQRPQREAPPWHAMPIRDVLQALDTRPSGLAPQQVRARYQPPPPRPSTLRQFTHQVGQELNNPFTPILALGAGMSALIGSWIDTGLVASVVGINALFGGAQRYRIHRALRRLHERERPKVRVRRGGHAQPAQVDPAELVVGDVIELEAGESVPADCRILHEQGLEVNESSLTGESMPIHKHRAARRARLITERTSMLYAGTTVVSGTVQAVVVALGDDTEAQRSLPIDGAPQPGGVEARLRALTRLSGPVAALGGALVGLVGIARGQRADDVLGAGVSLAVAAIPEGLPVLATIAQLSAAGRLSQRGVLVRNERALEALGRVQVLCADKTGTLTEGKIQLRRVSDGDEPRALEKLEDSHREVLRIALRASPDTHGRLPHMTDQALVEGARSVQVSVGGDGWERLQELPFEPERGFHAVLGREGEQLKICVKGAPEVLLPRSKRGMRGGTSYAMTPAARQAVMDACHRLAGDGLRVLAVAERKASERKKVSEERVDNLVFRGLVAFADPLRAEAKSALEDLRRAGVETLMITGDHPSTARAIAQELGLEETTLATGQELEAASEEELERLVAKARIFARVTPSQKMRIVRSLQRAGKVVAMTGDGANDAPAIRLADVGIAVGEDATEAARQAADLVVVDERIETIVQALLEGRALWSSVRDAVAILVGGNLGEIGFTVLGTLVRGTPPLNARQLLLVNLLTDAVPAMAVALRPPRTKSPEQLLDEGPDASLHQALTRDIVWRSTLTCGATLAAWLPATWMGSRARSSTVALLTLIGAQLGQTIAVGARSPLVWSSALLSAGAMVALVETPGVSHFLGCRPLGPLGLAQAGLAAGTATAVSLVAPRLTDAALERLGRVELGKWPAAELVRGLRRAPWSAGLFESAPTWLR